jgi:hypothetical protein
MRLSRRQFDHGTDSSLHTYDFRLGKHEDEQSAHREHLRPSSCSWWVKFKTQPLLSPNASDFSWIDISSFMPLIFHALNLIVPPRKCEFSHRTLQTLCTKRAGKPDPLPITYQYNCNAHRTEKAFTLWLSDTWENRDSTHTGEKYDICGRREYIFSTL